ncbi:MAG: dihydrofolate reductase [Candidatus Microsaccharimonas sp.]
MLSAIVAVTKNGVIGNSGELPWYLPADLRHFKEITTGHAVIMGRKTYDSIFARLGHALPDRQNIIVTRNYDIHADGIEIASSIADALALVKTENPFIIGGAQIYELASEQVDRWYVTEIDSDIKGDVTLKGFDTDKFKEVERVDHLADEKNPFDYHFVIYERI